MKKSAFTLAEILISLMILGVIAALTIPSLIQNTQKKEQIVQLKKGLSMINQAITMNYALTGNDLTNYASAADVADMLKKRLSVVQDSGYAANATDVWVRTQDGLTYFIGDRVAPAANGCGATDQQAVNGNAGGSGACYGIIISTKNSTQMTETTYATAKQNGVAAQGQNAILTGYYQFFASADRVVPTANTQKVMNAQDATEQKTDANPPSPEP